MFTNSASKGLMKNEPAAPLKISVIIPHLNQPDHLARCLSSLARGERLPDQVIVVDNGSLALPCCVQTFFPDGVLLEQTIPGPGPARNLGVAHATGDALAFIDADCVADPGWLAAAERHLTAARHEILGGDVRIGCEDAAHPTAIEAYESVFAYRVDHYITRHKFTGSGNLVVLRDTFDRVGQFKGRDVAEDRDWGQRATAMGYPIAYCPELLVYHPARRALKELHAKWDRQLSHDFATCKTFPARLRWVGKALALCFSPCVDGAKVLRSDRINGLRCRALAFFVLVRIRFYRARRMLQLASGLDREKLLLRWNASDA